MTTKFDITLTAQMTDVQRRQITGKQEIENGKKITAALAKKPDLTMMQLCAVTGIGKGHCQAALTMLQDHGQISVQLGSGHSGQTYALLQHNLPDMPAEWDDDARRVHAHLQGQQDTDIYMATLFGWDRPRVRNALGRLRALNVLAYNAVRMLPLYTIRGSERKVKTPAQTRVTRRAS